MQVTPYRDVDRMLALLRDRIQGILGEKLVGLYLWGSSVTGDFDILVSDIDLVAVMSTPLTRSELNRLARMHQVVAVEEKTWTNRVEVAYMTTEALKTFRTRPSTIARTSPGEPFHEREADKDWLHDWYVVREKGLALIGPSPATFIDPISNEELIQWVREHVEHWRAWVLESRKRNSQVYATLTLCRALFTSVTGQYGSKRQAATWTITHVPEWAPFIEEMLRSRREDWYNDDVDHEAMFPDTVRFVNDIVDRIVG